MAFAWLTYIYTFEFNFALTRIGNFDRHFGYRSCPRGFIKWTTLVFVFVFFATGKNISWMPRFISFFPTGCFCHFALSKVRVFPASWISLCLVLGITLPLTSYVLLRSCRNKASVLQGHLALPPTLIKNNAEKPRARPFNVSFLEFAFSYRNSQN